MGKEARLEISLYSYLYLKLAKMLWLSYYLLCFLFNKIGEKSRTGSAWKGRKWRGERAGGDQGEEKAQTMYAHMNK
jgi:hypothetical protein